MPVGTNITASSFANFVNNKKDELGQNKWNKLFTQYSTPFTQQYESSMRNYGNQMTSLTEDYSDVINQAYDSYVANKRAVEFSDYGTEDKINISEAYDKAYRQSMNQYKSQYLENTGKIAAGVNEVQSNYSEIVNELANNIAGQQSTLATNYADFFNSKYDYLEYLYENYSSESDVFGKSSYLSKFVDEENGTLMSRDNVIKMLSREENGSRVLDEGALDFIQAINSFKTYVEESHGDLKSFDAWLYESNPELAETMFGNNGLNANDFYQKLGLENAYDTKFLSDWLPDNTYVGDYAYEIKGLDSGDWNEKDKFDIIVDGQVMNFYASEHADPNVAKKLNKQATGDFDKTPDISDYTQKSKRLQMYDGEMYVYTKKNGWEHVDSNRDDIQLLKDTWNGTRQSFKVFDNFIKNYHFTYKGDDLHLVDSENGVTDFKVNKYVPKSVIKYLQGMLGDYDLSELKGKVYEYDGKYYISYGQNRDGYDFIELLNFDKNTKKPIKTSE